jgi:hypothetical protein
MSNAKNLATFLQSGGSIAGDANFDSNTLFVDASANAVGIGTSSPARKLTIQDSGAQMSLLSNTTGSSVLNLGDTDDDNIGRIQYNNSNNSMTFRTNTVDALTIDSSQNVDVAGTITSDGLTLDNNGSIIFNDPQATDTILIGTNDDELVIRADAGDIVLKTNNNSTSAVVDTSGNVGIGNSSPDTNLEISDTSGPVLRLSGHTGGVSGATPYDIGSIEFKSNDASGDGPRVVATVKTEADTTSTVPGGELVFETRGFGNGTSLDERMRIDSSGNVGIGIATPSTDLHLFKTTGDVGITVQSSATANAKAFVDLYGRDASNVNQIWKIENDAHSLRIKDDGSTKMTLNTSGNLGLGASSPSSNAIVKFIEIEDSTSAGVVLDAVRVFSMYSSSSSSLAFRDETASENRMVIDSSGRVGIGTGDPSSLTTLSASSSSAILELNRSNTNTTGAVGAINFTASDGHSVANIHAIGDGNNEGAHLVFRTTSSAGENSPYGSNTFQRMRISSTGQLFLFSQTSGAGNATLKYTTGTGAVTYDTSSRLVKENIVDCPYGLTEIVQLQPRKYFRTDDQANEVGLIADEVQSIMPEFVPTGEKSLITGIEEDTEIIPLGVNYDKMVAPLVQAIKDLNAKIETLETKVATLEGA